jgi:hypothetical protein
MQKQRFEKKYRISEELASGVREFVSTQLELDEHGAGRPGYSYAVHSLYLDSDDLATYWMTINGDKNRYKLRLRFYDDKPESPVFFEIKRRMDKIMLKQRCGVRKDAVPLVLAGQLPAPAQILSPDPKHLVAIQRFLELSQALEASPKVHVAYLREAWIDPHSDAIRVTFDRRVLGEPEPTTRFCTEMTRPVQPFGHEVILELKFTDRFPNWLREMVERFGLMQCGAAKYCECVDMIGEDRLGVRLRRRAERLRREESPSEVAARPADDPTGPSAASAHPQQPRAECDLLSSAQTPVREARKD